MVEKLIEVHSFFGVALEETQEKVGQFRAGTVRNPGQHIRNFYANFRPPSLNIAEQVELLHEAHYIFENIKIML